MYNKATAILFAKKERMMPWTYLAGGNFNIVFVNADRTEVLKVIHPDVSEIDSHLELPDRIERLWAEINPTLPPVQVIDNPFYQQDIDVDGLKKVSGALISKKKKCLRSQAPQACVYPFIEGTEPSEAEICKALIDIFNRTGRVVLDGGCLKNFIKRPSGEVVCIDLGLSFLLQKTSENLEKSIISCAIWDANEKTYRPFLKKGKNRQFIVINALLALQFFRPDITNADFLLQPKNGSLLKDLAAAFEDPSRFDPRRLDLRNEPASQPSLMGKAFSFFRPLASYITTQATTTTQKSHSR